MLALDFDLPHWLFLLPLALLPLFSRRTDAVDFPWISLLPSDSTGRMVDLALRALAILTIAFTVTGLAKPGRSETHIERIGRGAEILVLMDRSSSMDQLIRRAPPRPGEKAQVSQSKNDVVREALSWLLTQRPNNRYALTLFNVAPMRVAPFTDDEALVQAGLDASDIGRSPNKTNIDLALLAAIDEFEGRSYTGSRAILLVSDGGARLSDTMRERIKNGLERNRINLYFIYIQSGINSPNFEIVGTDVDAAAEEVALHVFFKSLDSEYQVFLADDRESMTAAITRIDQQQNLPLMYLERVPRIDYSQYVLIAALTCCGFLAALTATKLERLG